MGQSDDEQKKLQKKLLNLTKRPADSHKYDFGHVLVVGGSPGMVGAPFLAAEAALRTGAGLVTIAAGDNIADKLERRVEEVMTLHLPAGTQPALRMLSEFISKRKVSALVVGPGLPPDAAALVRELIAAVKLPTVLDAGGLAAFDGHIEELNNAAAKNPQLILTPHAGEFARLTGTETPKQQPAREQAAAGFAETYGVLLVLKGHPTIVAYPGGGVYVNQTGGPSLATAGTGDVLSGIIAGLLAQKFEPALAAEAGVYLHGLAGDILAARNAAGIIATDVIEAIPDAFNEVSKQ